MAYDEQLAARVRDLLIPMGRFDEKSMFGGLAFLIDGNMAVAVSGQGGLLVRVDPEDTEDLLDRPHAALMVMSGRPTKGWLRVGPEGVNTQQDLSWWVHQGVRRAGSLPPK